MINQGIAGNARLVVVGLGETAVDDHQLTICLDRILALQGAHWHVTIDDVAVLAVKSEGIHDVVYHLFVVAQLEVVAFLLLMGLLVGDEIALEGSHLALVEEWTVRAAPQIDEVVDGVFLLVRVAVLLKGGANLHACMVHQFLSAIFLSWIDFHLF